VSSPTKAGAVLGAPPAIRYRRRTGCTGTPASSAAWKTARRKRPWARPHQVLPSGNTATACPARSAPATRATVPGSARSRSRSMNRTPPRSASAPATGHCRISVLASIRAGRTAPSRGMSSHEMWLATRSSPPLGTAAAPVIRTRTPAARTIHRHHHRTTPAGIHAPNGASTTPASTSTTTVTSRSTARGTAVTEPAASTHAPGVQGALGSQTLIRPGRARGSAADSAG
jgi:hypothetical protein